MSIPDIDLANLAERFGTPLYVYDGDRLTRTLADLRAALHPALDVLYSLKANPNISVVAALRAAGAGAEVSSLVELRTALLAGVSPTEIVFLGPGKSDEELLACLEAGIYAIVCESLDELDRIEKYAAERGSRQRVLLRINPAHSVGGSRLTMAGKPRQFGIDEIDLLVAEDLASRYQHADIAGIHAYLGTRILDPEVIGANTRYVLDLADRVARATGIRLDAVDIGGGLGVAYFDGERDLDLAELAGQLNPPIERFAAAHPQTRLILESGRYLTGLAGIYIVGVRYVKRSMGEWFAITDGGTHHHMAAVGVGSFVKRNFPVMLLDRTPDPAGELLRWTVTGPLCTPNDTLVKRAKLPPLQVGDLLGVLRSGAYGPSASPGHFLSHGYPAEIMIHGGRTHLVRTRDEPDDLLRKQRLYEPKDEDDGPHSDP